MPGTNYDAMLSELLPLIELGREIDAELIELQGITRQHKLGMMPDMKNLRKELAKLMAELETVLASMYDNKRQHIAETGAFKMTCLYCRQHIELNADAETGQAFNCPSCQHQLFVPAP